MTYETTLATVRELSEYATRRPATKRLRLHRPEPVVIQHATNSFEELYPVRIGGHTAHGTRPDRRNPAHRLN